MTHTARLGDRRLFPALRAGVYANHAAISPPSAAVEAAVLATLRGYGSDGLAWFPHEVERRARVRGQLTALRFAPHWPNDVDRELPLLRAALDAVRSEFSAP